MSWLQKAMTAADIFHQIEVDEANWRLAFQLGQDLGYRQGYQAAENDMATAWADLARSVRASANAVPYTELERRRAEVVRPMPVDPNRLTDRSSADPGGGGEEGEPPVVALASPMVWVRPRVGGPAGNGGRHQGVRLAPNAGPSDRVREERS